MDDNKKKAAIMGAAACVIAVGQLLLDDIRRRIVQLSREPRNDRVHEREVYINGIIYGADYHCVNQIRMRPVAFFKLCKILGESHFLRETINMSIKEQVLIFLYVIGHNVRFRVVGKRLHRSIETVHRCFRVVLQAVLRLYKLVVRQPGDSTPAQIRNSTQFYPYFKDCVGAIDGTHVRASVPSEIQGRFYNWKGETTQHVLAGITFDLKFTYVLAGWEGSAEDSRVLYDAFSRPGGFTLPEGKYYLGDSGYGNGDGVLSPYPGVRHHLEDFNERPPENEKELYNFRHSSLRTTTKRSFGVLKQRFRILDANKYWSVQTQVDVVLACCLLHNFISEVDPRDPIMEEVRQSESEDHRILQTSGEEMEEIREWNMKRDEIAQAMWEDYYISRENL